MTGLHRGQRADGEPRQPGAVGNRGARHRTAPEAETRPRSGAERPRGALRPVLAAFPPTLSQLDRANRVAATARLEAYHHDCRHSDSNHMPSQRSIFDGTPTVRPRSFQPALTAQHSTGLDNTGGVGMVVIMVRTVFAEPDPESVWAQRRRVAVRAGWLS